MGIQEEALVVINRAREAGFLEFTEMSEVIAEVRGSSGNEVNAILYRAGEEPLLINAAEEGDYVSLALLDLNLIEELDINETPNIRDVFRDLEDLTTKVGYELYGDKSKAPFLFPLKLNEEEGRALVIVGIKSAVPGELFNESFLEGLIEDLEFNSDAYLNQLISALRVSHST
jgi:hypothetical protein